MDKSLDEVISSRPKNTRRGAASRRGGAGAKAQLLGTSGRPTSRTTVATVKAAATTVAPQPADKIIVSNLPGDVNEVQIKELFHSTVGPLRDVTLHYDSAGRSKGVAAVHFQRKGDGTKAYQQYNNRLIDGKRPMKIEIVVDPARPAPPASLVSRVAPPAAAAAAATSATEPQGTRSAARGSRRGRGRGRKGNERPQKSVADLDAEMEDYTATSAPAAAAAA